jgi:hypothetical protein
LVGEKPGLGENKADIELADIIKDNVRTCRFQFGPLPGPVYADDQTESSGPGGPDTSHGIFNHGRTSSRHPNSAGRFEEQCRVRLPRQLEVRRDLSIHNEIKLIQQPGTGQNGSGIPARSG